ncbi:unnamed protein product, partial [Polarella glacialis]
MQISAAKSPAQEKYQILGHLGKQQGIARQDDAKRWPLTACDQNSTVMNLLGPIAFSTCTDTESDQHGTVMHIVVPRDMPFATHDMIVALALPFVGRVSLLYCVLRLHCAVALVAAPVQTTLHISYLMSHLVTKHLFHVVGADTDSEQSRHCNIDRHLVQDKHCPVCKTPIDIMAKRLERVEGATKNGASVPPEAEGHGSRASQMRIDLGGLGLSQGSRDLRVRLRSSLTDAMPCLEPTNSIATGFRAAKQGGSSATPVENAQPASASPMTEDCLPGGLDEPGDSDAAAATLPTQVLVSAAELELAVRNLQPATEGRGRFQLDKRERAGQVGDIAAGSGSGSADGTDEQDTSNVRLQLARQVSRTGTAASRTGTAAEWARQQSRTGTAAEWEGPESPHETGALELARQQSLEPWPELEQGGAAETQSQPALEADRLEMERLARQQVAQLAQLQQLEQVQQQLGQQRAQLLEQQQFLQESQAAAAAQQAEQQPVQVMQQPIQEAQRPQERVETLQAIQEAQRRQERLAPAAAETPQAGEAAVASAMAEELPAAAASSAPPTSARWQPFTQAEKVYSAYAWRHRRLSMLRAREAGDSSASGKAFSSEKGR